MDRDLICFIICVVFTVGLIGVFVGNIGLEDYFIFGERSEKKNYTAVQEETDELMQHIENSEEIQRIEELRQSMQHYEELKQQIDELDKGDDD